MYDILKWCATYSHIEGQVAYIHVGEWLSVRSRTWYAKQLEPQHSKVNHRHVNIQIRYVATAATATAAAADVESKRVKQRRMNKCYLSSFIFRWIFWMMFFGCCCAVDVTRLTLCDGWRLWQLALLPSPSTEKLLYRKLIFQNKKQNKIPKWNYFIKRS